MANLSSKLDIVGQSVTQSSQPVLDEFLQAAVKELVQKLLQVSPGRLRTSSNRHGLAVEVARRGASLIQVRPLFLKNYNRKSRFIHYFSQYERKNIGGQMT